MKYQSLFLKKNNKKKKKKKKMMSTEIAQKIVKEG